MFKVIKESHTHAGITPQLLEWAQRETQGLAGGFFKATLDLPADAPSLPCELRGPLVGDPPIGDELCFWRARGKREYSSRMTKLQPGSTRKVTVIAGPEGTEPCVLYTIYPGSIAPREPNDPSLANASAEEVRESEMFWRQHALCAPVPRVLNLTPHPVTVVDALGARYCYGPEKVSARVATVDGIGMGCQLGVPTVHLPQLMDVTGLPEPEEGTIYLVSLMVLQALEARLAARVDVFAPATGPNDGVIRNDKGQVEAVTRLLGLN